MTCVVSVTAAAELSEVAAPAKTTKGCNMLPSDSGASPSEAVVDDKCLAPRGGACDRAGRTGTPLGPCPLQRRNDMKGIAARAP